MTNYLICLVLHLSLVDSPKIHSVSVKYLHQVKHVFVQNIFSQLVPHLGSWIKLKMIQGQLFMIRQWHFTLIIVECINKVFPQDILSLDQFKTSGSIFIHTALQNVVSNFLKIVLKMKKNYYEKLKFVSAWMLWGEMGQNIWCRKAQIINVWRWKKCHFMLVSAFQLSVLKQKPKQSVTNQGTFLKLIQLI